MNSDSYGAAYWNNVAKNMVGKYHLNEFLCKQKKSVHLDLISRWVDISSGRNVLKTDLFEEALGSDHFLFDLARINANAVGIDIAYNIAHAAKRMSKQYGLGLSEIVCCDVRRLPFKDDSFSLVISNSTLDHFEYEVYITAALKELWRIIEPGGTLIITMDNKRNLTEPIFRLWLALGFAPFFVGRTYSIEELKQALEKIGFIIKDATAIIHNPRLLTRKISSFLHCLDSRRFDPWIRKGLAFLDRLENKRTKYLTALYIAVNAVKCEKS